MVRRSIYALISHVHCAVAEALGLGRDCALTLLKTASARRSSIPIPIIPRALVLRRVQHAWHAILEHFAAVTLHHVVARRVYINRVVR